MPHPLDGRRRGAGVPEAQRGSRGVTETLRIGHLSLLMIGGQYLKHGYPVELRRVIAGAG
jgi:hypothetical protein